MLPSGQKESAAAASDDVVQETMSEMANNNASDSVSDRKLILSSLNCEGASRNDCYIKKILAEDRPDFLCLQETWLQDGNSHMLNKLCSDYMSVSKSGVNNVSDIITGRIPGGVAILYKKGLCHSVNEILFESRRVCGIRISMFARCYLLINVYLPVDQQSMSIIHVEYEQALNEIEGIINATTFNDVIICGDYNTDLSRNNLQTETLCQFIERNELKIGWESARAQRGMTYVNVDLNHVSTIDHILLNDNLFSVIDELCVVSDVMNRSYHSLIRLKLDASAEWTAAVHSVPRGSGRRKWLKAQPEHKERYASELARLLVLMEPDGGLMACGDMHCTNQTHKDAIDKFCENIIRCCIDAEHLSIPDLRMSRGRQMPGWNDVVRSHHQVAKFWHSLWVQCDKPLTGHVYEIMKAIRRTYHYAVRQCKSDEQLWRKRRLAELCSRDEQEFWRQVKRVNSTPGVSTTKMDDAVGNDAIAELLANKYKALYQSVPTQANEMSELSDLIADRLANETVEQLFFTFHDVDKAVKRLKKGKSDDQHMLYSDHLINGGEALSAFLSMLFNCMLCHGHTPLGLLSSAFISIPKNPKASMSDSANYRSIALCSSINKLLDLLVIDKWRGKLVTSDLQFGFRRAHSTVLCTAMYKETVQHFAARKSTVYSVLLDASKAFDKVRYGALFKLLIGRNLPAAVLRLLLDSYTRQTARVSWCDVRSPPFHVLNGVKQGGVLSPVLFTVYVDYLLITLQQSGIGCFVDGHYCGAYCYADDIVLLCPSLDGLNQMLEICYRFACDFDVTFNAQKTIGICFNSKWPVLGHAALNGVKIAWQDKVKHLGNVINARMTDDDDCKAKMGQFIGSVNKLIANFKHLELALRVKLFKSFCSSFYGSQMWNFNCSSLLRVYTAWNKAVRVLLRIPYCTHRWMLGPLIESLHIREQLYIRTAGFLKSAMNCGNATVLGIVNAATRDARTDMGANIAFFRDVFDVHFTDTLDLKAVNEAVASSVVLTERQASDAELCAEILDVLEGYSVNGLSDEENSAVLHVVCTS